MAERKYFWLKLKEDFFESKRIKKLRKLAGGDTLTIIYLKMQLKSINNDGYLSFSGLEKTFAEELALDIDESPEDVGLLLNYLVSVGLIETSDNVNFLLPYAQECIGSETASAQRKRDQRLRERDNVTLVSQESPKLSQVSHTEIDIEKEKEIERDKDINNSPKGSRVFVPPTEDEVRAYCLERNNGIDPKGFINYYEMANWMLKGNRKMKDWKAAVRYWETLRDGEKQPSSTKRLREG